MIEKLYLDKRLLFRILISYLLMTIIWSVTCFWLDQYFGENKFHVKAIGFITLFGLSFVFGIRIKDLSKVIFLLIIFLTTFYFVSFIIGPLYATVTNNSLLLSGFLMSATSATILVAALSQFKKIEFASSCIAVTTVFAMPAYLTSLQTAQEILYLNFNIHPSILMFNLWQGLTILPLSLGLAVKRRHRSEIAPIQNELIN